jgi:hypothetical protein
MNVVPPYSNRGLHPYAIALAEGAFHAWGQESDSAVVCLIRWPQPGRYPNMEMPVVLMERGAKGMNLVARSPREYVTRTLAEEDFEVGVICFACF